MDGNEVRNGDSAKPSKRTKGTWGGRRQGAGRKPGQARAGATAAACDLVAPSDLAWLDAIVAEHAVLEANLAAELVALPTLDQTIASIDLSLDGLSL